MSIDPWEATNEELERLCQIADGVAKTCWPHVIQLYCREVSGDDCDERDEPESVGNLRAFGSGVLVQHAGKLCIFSAAHVLAPYKNAAIWTVLDGDLILPIEGPPLLVGLTGDPGMEDHQGDPVDAGVLLLDSDNAAKVRARPCHLPTNRTSEDRDNCLFLLLGYPTSLTTVDDASLEFLSDRKPLIFAEADDSVYRDAGWNKRTHLLFNLRDECRNTEGTIPRWNLKGASGGGIWRFNPDAPDSEPDFVATFTEVSAYKEGRVLVGTRIQVHKTVIARIVEE